jgi:hypothetical protein
MIMSWKDYFVVGLKLIGLYCLLQGFEGIFRVFPGQLQILQRWGQLHGVFKLSALMSMMIPVIMGVLGLYLIRDGERLHGIPNFEDSMDESRGWIALGIVLFGFYLLAGAVPDVLHIIPDLALVLQAPAYVSRDGSISWLKSTFFSTSVTVLLGMVCIFRGQAIATLAFKQVLSEQKDVQ